MSYKNTHVKGFFLFLKNRNVQQIMREQSASVAPNPIEIPIKFIIRKWPHIIDIIYSNVFSVSFKC